MNAVRIGCQIFVTCLFVVSLSGCPTIPVELGNGPILPPSPPPPLPPPPGVPQEVLAMEVAAHDLINEERAKAGRSLLIMRDDLRSVARAHSEDMIARNFFDHTNPSGESPWDRMRNAGITSWSSAGENIAWNARPPGQRAEFVVGQWMGSTGHRNNILNGGFTHTGMGAAVSASGRAYFTQVFIRASKELPEAFIRTWYEQIH